MSFAGKVVIVTGASSGIGATTAMMFAKEGARVALVARNETKLTDLSKKIEALGTPTLIIKADVSNEKEAGTIVKKTVDHFGQLDVLVNNAGISRRASVADQNILQNFDEVINTNLRSIVQLSSLAAPHLVKTKGNIVNVSSIAALKVLGPNLMSYSVSKAALDHFTRCAALDLAPSGVRVNSVNPGPVKTAIIENMRPVNFEVSELWKHAERLTLFGRVSEPEEIADVIIFLASDKARSITGSTYVSDNGALLKTVHSGV